MEISNKVTMFTAFILVGIAFMALRTASGISSDYAPLPGGYIPAEGIMKLNRRS